jgi:rhodanese-related sulfurtransferase
MTPEQLAESLSAEDARTLIASGEEATVVDIRPDEEWDEGRIAGAEHHTEETVIESLGDLPADTPMVIVCADGERSAKLAARLREEGRDAASIDGGMEAWAKEGLPVQPRPDEEFEGPDYSKPPGGSG